MSLPPTITLTIPVRAEASINLDRLARAISQIESQDNDYVRGRAGEVSRFQMKPSVWRQNTDRPIADAQLHWIAYLVAMQHLQHLNDSIRNPTPWRIALAWKCGLRAFLRDSYLDTDVDFATRCERVYQLLR